MFALGNSGSVEEFFKKHTFLRFRLLVVRISESNQLVGRILELKVDGLIAQVAIAIGDYRLTSIITADAASELRLKIGDNVVALLKSSQVMILRNQI